MPKFDYAGFFSQIGPLADATRESPTRFWEPSPAQLAEPHEYVLYLGCNVLRTVHLAEAIVAVLQALGVDFVTLGGPSNCCGIVHHRNGDTAVSTTMTQHTMDKFTKVNAKAVLMYCPSCHSHFDKRLPAGDLEFDLPYLHVTEFIAERIGRLKFTQPIPRRIGLHCHVGPAQQRTDTANTLKILRAVPGLEVVELRAGPEWGIACAPNQITLLGARFGELVGGMFAAAKAAGCDGAAAVYHSCYRELVPYEATHGLEWLNYVELLAEALSLGPFRPQYKALKLAQDPDAAFAALAPRAAERGGNLERLRKSVDWHFKAGSPGVVGSPGTAGPRGTAGLRGDTGSPSTAGLRDAAKR